jgi:hypothetical protein
VIEESVGVDNDLGEQEWGGVDNDIGEAEFDNGERVDRVGSRATLWYCCRDFFFCNRNNSK